MSPVGLGLVGLGRWSRAHAEAAARSDQVQFVSCFSRTKSRRDEFARDFGIGHTAGTFAELLADPSVEAVVIATPNDLHVDMALEAMAAGKPALVDKPICVDIEGGLRLIRATPSASQVGVAHHPRRLAAVRAAKQWIDSSGGVVRFADANFSNERGAHLSPDAWYANVEGSEAGVLIQVGIHQVDNVLYLFGPAVAVNARFTFKATNPMPDGATLIVTHASGTVSTLTSSWTTPGLFSIEVQSTAGNLRCRADHRRWKEIDVDVQSSVLLDTIEEHDVAVPLVPGDPLAEQLNELGATARGTSTMEVEVADGVRAMAVVLAAVRSSANGGAEVSIASLLETAGATTDEVATLVA